jgi:hypothetical protein
LRRSIDKERVEKGRKLANGGEDKEREKYRKE